MQGNFTLLPDLHGSDAFFVDVFGDRVNVYKRVVGPSVGNGNQIQLPTLPTTPTGMGLPAKVSANYWFKSSGRATLCVKTANNAILTISFVPTWEGAQGLTTNDWVVIQGPSVSTP